MFPYARAKGFFVCFSIHMTYTVQLNSQEELYCHLQQQASE